MRYITSLESNIRNGGNFPKPACRQRADGEETWPCLAIRAQQPGIGVDLDTKAKGIEPKYPVRSHAFQKARVADTRAFHAGAIDDPIDLQFLNHLCMPNAITNGDALLLFIDRLEITRVDSENAV